MPNKYSPQPRCLHPPPPLTPYALPDPTSLALVTVLNSSTTQALSEALTDTCTDKQTSLFTRHIQHADKRSSKPLADWLADTPSPGWASVWVIPMWPGASWQGSTLGQWMAEMAAHNVILASAPRFTITWIVLLHSWATDTQTGSQNGRCGCDKHALQKNRDCRWQAHKPQVTAEETLSRWIQHSTVSVIHWSFTFSDPCGLGSFIDGEYNTTCNIFDDEMKKVVLVLLNSSSSLNTSVPWISALNGKTCKIQRKSQVLKITLSMKYQFLYLSWWINN